MNQPQYRAQKVKVAQIWRFQTKNFSRSDIDLTAKTGGWSLDSDKSISETEEEQDRSTPQQSCQICCQEYITFCERKLFL